MSEGSNGKTGGGSNMSFYLSLANGEDMGKDTGVDQMHFDMIFANLIHFGQPLVYKSMVTKNCIRNEGPTNRYQPDFDVRVGFEHAETVDSDEDSDDDEPGVDVAAVRLRRPHSLSSRACAVSPRLSHALAVRGIATASRCR